MSLKRNTKASRGRLAMAGPCKSEQKYFALRAEISASGMVSGWRSRPGPAAGPWRRPGPSRRRPFRRRSPASVSVALGGPLALGELLGRHLLERHRLVGQHRAALRRHLGEAADDEEALLDLVALEHFEHARTDRRDQRRMAGQDAEVAFAARHDDHVGLGRENLALGHDQPEGDLGHRLRPPRPRASWPCRPPPRSCRPCRRPAPAGRRSRRRRCP